MSDGPPSPPATDSDAPLGFSGRLARFFRHSQLTPLLALAGLLLGAFAVLVTPREEEPQINVTFANVMVPFPGASSAQVESLVASPMEQVLGEIRWLPDQNGFHGGFTGKTCRKAIAAAGLALDAVWPVLE